MVGSLNQAPSGLSEGGKVGCDAIDTAKEPFCESGNFTAPEGLTGSGAGVRG